MFFLKSVLRITILLILILFPTEVESSTLFSPSSAWETEGQIRSLNSSVLSSHSSPLCMLSHFSPVWLFATLWTVAHQALLSMGFSRQEYWSGFPCPPPGDIPNPGIEPRPPALQVDSLPSEPSGEHKNTGVHTLSLLQGIFPTQESNWGLLHCRWILYQLNGIIGFCFLIPSLPWLFGIGTQDSQNLPFEMNIPRSFCQNF